MQFFNQFEISIMEKLKTTEYLIKFLNLLNLKVTKNDIDIINHFKDINEIDELPDKYVVVFQKFIVRRTRDFEFFILKNDKFLYFYATTKEFSDFKKDIIANNNFNPCDNQSLNLDKRYAKFFKKFSQFTNNLQIFVISGFEGDDKKFMMTREGGVKNISKNVIQMINKKSVCKCTSGNCQKCNCKDNLYCNSKCHNNEDNHNCTKKRKYEDIFNNDDDDDD